MPAYPKPKRVVNKRLIRTWPRERCEICRARVSPQAHHIISVGSGGPDHKFNLITLCFYCHEKAHRGVLTREYLFRRVGYRERVSLSHVVDVVMNLKV